MIGIRIMTFTLLLIGALFAGVQQVQDVHMYIVREAWDLLRTQYPAVESTDLANHIGTSEEGSSPWETGLVVTGAYREDEEDPIYGYATPFTSITHFWNADLGDDFKWNYAGEDWENNFQKSKAYLYGEHIIVIEKAEWVNPPGQIITARIIKYGNLFNFYNTGEYYYCGYFDLAGQPHLFQNPIFTQYPIDTARKYAYEILGRICHLLADTGTPAHAHNDAHVPIITLDDKYEDWMENNHQNWTYQDALSAGGVFFDIQAYNYPLRFLMYTTNQIADHFPSDDRSGDNNYSATYGGDTYTVLDDIYAALGDPPSSVNPSDIADHAFVYSIQSTAAILYWFALETNQIQPPQPLSVSIAGPSYLQYG